MSSDKFDFLYTVLEFEDLLNRLIQGNRELPIPCFMKRIHTLLGGMLSTRQRYDCESESDWDSEERPPRRHCFCKETNTVSKPLQPRNLTSKENVFRPRQPTYMIKSVFLNAVRKMRDAKGPLFVDILWLTSDRGDAVKEFAVTCEGTPAACILIKSPEGAVPDWRQYRFIVNHYHGIDWDDGEIDSIDLKVLTRPLFGNGRPVYCKGDRKAELLAKVLTVKREQVSSLEDLPNLETLVKRYPSPPCLFHSNLDKTFCCALRRVKALATHHSWSTTPKS